MALATHTHTHPIPKPTAVAKDTPCTLSSTMPRPYAPRPALLSENTAGCSGLCTERGGVVRRGARAWAGRAGRGQRETSVHCP
eukprot:1593265-Rhodomonas_salina.1